MYGNKSFNRVPKLHAPKIDKQCPSCYRIVPDNYAGKREIDCV